MNINKSLVFRTFSAMLVSALALMSADSVAAELSNITINGSPATTGIQLQATNPPTIAVTYAGTDAVWVKFRQNDATWRVQMTLSGSVYSVKMPVLPVGTVYYKVERGPVFDPIASIAVTEALPAASTEYHNYVNIDTLGILRKPDLTVWRTKVGESQSYTGALDNNNKWVGRSVSMAFDNTVYLAGKPVAGQPYIDPGIRSMEAVNSGSIWFKAKYNGNSGSGTLVIEKSSLALYSSAHQIITSVTVPASSEWHLFRIDVDSEALAYYRIRHPSGLESDPIIIKDIVITPLAADVAMTKDPVEFTPGYPSRLDPVTFSINVTNKYATAPAANISPKLIWRLNGGAWSNTPMSAVGGSKYSVTLPPMVPGNFEYYYRTDFTGYAYVGPIAFDGFTTIANEASFSKWLSPGKIISESRNPGYMPDFPNSQLYNLNVDQPVNKNDGSTLDLPFDYYSFEVRRFRSKHDDVSLLLAPAVVGDPLPLDPEHKMEQVGDYTWQSVLYTTNALNIGMEIIGTYRYNTGATAYEPQPRIWGDEDQAETARNPPMSGNAVDTASVPPIRMEIDYKGFLMVRFCTTNGYYEVRRAAWQDFNTWQAPNTEFSRSYGLYETKTYPTDLTGIPASIMVPTGFIPFENYTLTGGADRYIAFESLAGLKVQNSWLIEERLRSVPTNIPLLVRNNALRISASPTSYGIGSVETTSLTASSGRDTLKMRVRASVNDNNLAYYRKGVAFDNYQVLASVHTAAMSPDNASVSVFGYYQDPGNYMEFRATQMTTLNPNPNTPYTYSILLEVRQMKGGVETILKNVTYSSGNPQLTSKKWRMMLQLASSSATGGNASATLFDDAGNQVSTISSFTFTIDSSVPIGGTIGVNARDAAAAFEVSMLDSTGASAAPFSAVATSPISDWYLGGNMEGTSMSRWAFAPGAGGVPITLTRTIPNVKYRVNVYRAGIGGSTYTAPITFNSGWDQDWDVDGSASAERSTSNLNYTDVAIPMHLWDDVFIQIKPVGSDGGLVIDDLSCQSWRGMTIYDPAPGDNDPNRELVWEASYAVARPDNGNMVYEFTRSRSNPAEEQKLVSPLLVKGLGDMLFNYKVVAGTVSFSVQSLYETGEVQANLMTTNVTAQSPAVYERMYVPLLTNLTGRFRIIINGADSTSDGSILIDNVKATDYPNVGDTSWMAYNVLISTYPWNPSAKFDGASHTEYRSATLNNSMTNDTPLGIAYTDDDPYLQSPKIATGIGEVSFWYRSYPDPDDPAAPPGKLYLRAAQDVNDPVEDWITLAVVDLNPLSSTYIAQSNALSGLVHIDTDAWTSFNVEFYKADYKVLRIYGDTENSGRVMIDNIIVTEPVRTSIDVGAVRLIPEVPLYTDKVGVRVNLINPRMNPQNIKVDLLYYIGTNVWGVANWKGNSQMHRVALQQDPTDKYLFSVQEAIPQLPIDSVVQYAVEVDYDGTFASPVFYDGADFVNPPWYTPVNLNSTFSSQGISPYYFVFSVGTNAVFINEFLPYSETLTAIVGLSEQYVELIGPANADISNWKLEHIAVANNASSVSDVSFWTNVMKQGASFTERYKTGSTEPTDKGWGMYLLANPGVSVTNSRFSVPLQNSPITIDQELFPASLYTADYKNFSNTQQKIGMKIPGGLKLTRSMGAYVHRVAWGSTFLLDPLVQRGYTALDSRSSSSRQVYMWSQNYFGELAYVLQDPDRYSPGYYNHGQADLIWTVESTVPPPVVLPQVAVAVSAISVDSVKATVTFSVNTTNGVALTGSDGFTWYIETSPDASFQTPTAHQITTPVTAADTGAPSSFAVDINLGSPAAPALFYRVKATHP